MEEIEALAQAWPRPLIAVGAARPLAAAWVASRTEALAAGEPPWARHATTPALGAALFEIRRAGRIVRGLEAARDALARQDLGLAQSAATRVRSGERRISRMLVLSADGAPRFYRDAQKLCVAHAARLEALVIDADETWLGESTFGRGRVARALLVDHKQAVVQLLESLDFAA